jgi:hypothetical protein
MLKICFKDQNCLKILVFQIFHLISIMFKNMSMTSTLHELKYCAIYKLCCIHHMHRNLKLPQLSQQPKAGVLNLMLTSNMVLFRCQTALFNIFINCQGSRGHFIAALAAKK